MRTVQLVSGGLDSELVSELYPDAERLFVDYGQPEQGFEYHTAKELWPDVKVVRIIAPGLERQGTYYPARNLLLASVAVMYCGAHRVLMGGMADDNCADKTPEAFRQMSSLLTVHAGHDVHVMSPFWNKDKSTAVAEYLNRAGKVDRLERTFSCYSPRGGSCLKCEACFRWWVALRSNGVDVPTPDDSIVMKYLKKLHEYSAPRRWAILNALRAVTSVTVVDIDGVLCNEAGGHNYAERVPIMAAVEKMKSIMGIVVLYSSRREIDRRETEDWLDRYGVPRHALLLDKPPYHSIIDDRSFKSLVEPKG